MPPALASTDIWFRLVQIFLQTYTFRILVNSWVLLRELFPWLLAGLLVAVLIRKAFLGLHRKSFLRGEGALNIALAAVAGMLAPLPFYLAVPLSAVFICSGVPSAVVVAFLVACPLIDPNLFLLTWGAFGWEMAAARVLTAFLLGVGGGLAWRRFAGGRAPAFRNSLLARSESQTGQITGRGFRASLLREGWFIAKVFGVSILISAAIQALVSPEYVQAISGDSTHASVLLAIAAGVPFYQCGGASIPIMQALSGLGLSQGAVLAFFTSGPVTKVSSMYAFREGFGGRMFLLFLAWTVAGAFLAGVGYNLMR